MRFLCYTNRRFRLAGGWKKKTNPSYCAIIFDFFFCFLKKKNCFLFQFVFFPYIIIYNNIRYGLRCLPLLVHVLLHRTYNGCVCALHIIYYKSSWEYLCPANMCARCTVFMWYCVVVCHICSSNARPWGLVKNRKIEQNARGPSIFFSSVRHVMKKK